MPQHQREPGVYLDTLAFRCTPELVGDDCVYVRHLDRETQNLWSNFDRQCQRRYGDDQAQAPYSIATTVLSALSGGYVHFDANYREPFLASREPLDDNLLRRVFTLTHGLALGEPVESIDLRNGPELATRIASTPQTRYSLAERLHPGAGTQPTAPAWVYRTITWGLSRQFADEPWVITGGRKIPLRPDTTGGLVAVADPWENDQGGRFALSRTSLQLITLPNISRPVLAVTSRVTRIAPSVVFSKTALAVPVESDRPIVEISLNGRGGARTINRLALEALGRLQMDYSLLHGIARRSQAEQKLLAAAKESGDMARFPRENPGQIWPILPKSYSFPIGVGTGMQHLRDLHRHYTDTFGDRAEPLTIRESGMTLPHRPTDPERVTKKELDRRKEEREKAADNSETLPPLRARGSAVPQPAVIGKAVETTGFAKLLILCLWYRDETRQRMLATLKNTYGLDVPDPHQGQEFSLYGDKITAVFHYAPDFLKPGGPEGRQQALQAIQASLGSGDGVLVGAWCETEYPTADELNDTDGKGADKTNLDDVDAKHQTKSVLARHGIASQYLRGRNEEGAIRPTPKDYPAEMALLDLYRSLGILDERIAKALQPRPEHTAYAADRKAHVAFHIRQQNNRKGERGSPRVVITATALMPPDEPGGIATMLGWSSTKPVWQPYRTAQTDFHATTYPQENGTKKNYRQRWDTAAETVEMALEDLVEELEGTPYTITVDGPTARRAWDGLHNLRQGTPPQERNSQYWLPGSTLSPDQRPDAVIRINTAEDEVPPPVGTTRFLKGKPGEAREGQTTRMLYEIATDFGTPVWLLCNVPRAYDGDGAGRLGSKYTRWHAKRSVHSEVKTERRKSEMPENWYSMTATEIFPIACRPGIPEEALATATSQLCHQTAYWSDRARFPVPLHAAKQMDLDHPQYRRTVPPEQQYEAGQPDDSVKTP